MRTIYAGPAGVRCYRTRMQEPGECPRCGSVLVYRDITGLWYCPRRTRDPLWKIRSRSAGRLHFAPECFEWLGEKLGIAADDERLPNIAIDLARAKKLMVLVSKRGSIIALAKAPDSNTGTSSDEA